MRLLLLLAFSSFTFVSLAQNNVGIGVPAPANRLHVSSLPDGNPLRIEGVVGGAVTDSILTLNPQGVVRKRTVASVLSGSAGWALTGNAPATNTGTSFLGTTNASSLFFRTNNLRSGFIDFDSTKRNNSFGNRALSLVSTGTANNAFGYQALNSLTTGTGNIALGDSAAFTLTNGADNILIGADAGLILNSGSQNVGIGSRTLSAAIAASDNIAIGARTLEQNIASANIAIGSLALNKNTFGSNNIAVGSNALGQTTGAFSDNIAIGNSALAGSTGSTEQVAVGFNAGLALTGGSYNILFGNYALGAATAGNYNVAIGHQAGTTLANANSVNNSNNNTFLGALTTTTAPAGGGVFSNSTALGYAATITQSNMVRVGGTGTTLINGFVGFSTTSDERVKTNIREDVKGLTFISLLRPVTYNYDLQKIDDMQKVPPAARTPYAEKQKIRYTGFLAQEVEKAAQQTGYDFSGVNKPQNPESLYSIDYSSLVVPLVKAVQELKAIVEKQQAEIEKLKAAVSQQPVAGGK